MKKYRSDDEWRELIARQKRSDKSIAIFCREKGIHPNLFYRKKKSLQETGKLVRLPALSPSRATIEITIGCMTIEVTGGFADTELVRVLRCVREAANA